ncbi:uncharacterized protein LOC105664808 [Ceratitis capitata]|uniref:uncharacterized protein LOC105664808 n=1 Tax=Ceratitis capitata TaxID=7213 RepID=UPI0006189169|nr:uncharacterized protein LOC105664808 [Ceratitis capitata]
MATKKTILSITSSLFDSLATLKSVSSLTVPCYCLQPDTHNIQIHGFCDASIRAYSCSVYLRTQSSHGQVDVHLLTSKSRVAPVKKQSLPKLELCDDHLLACLYAKMKDIFSTGSVTTYFLTDSQLVLHWLQQYSITLSTFVGNRVSDIQALTVDKITGFELINVGDRLGFADLPGAQKHPILLPSTSQFVLNYVRYLHRRNYHAGSKALVALIRLEYWIVNDRDLTLRVVRSCVHCVRYKPVLAQQVIGPHPATRITLARPFERCGVDFCGPINIYLRIRGRAPTKSYLAVFVCFVTKAVLTEVVSDLSTHSFFNALKRMGGRRKLPCDIFCDNAINFVGASN